MAYLRLGSMQGRNHNGENQRDRSTGSAHKTAARCDCHFSDASPRLREDLDLPAECVTKTVLFPFKIMPIL
jgi:hypothetical protein